MTTLHEDLNRLFGAVDKEIQQVRDENAAVLANKDATIEELRAQLEASNTSLTSLQGTVSDAQGEVNAKSQALEANDPVEPPPADAGNPPADPGTDVTPGPVASEPPAGTPVDDGSGFGVPGVAPEANPSA